MTFSSPSYQADPDENSPTHPEPVLIALLGKSPAILTETVYAMAMQEEPLLPERIVAVTTSEGRDTLKDRLFGTEGQWSAFKQHLSAKLGRDLSDVLRFGPIEDCIRVIPAPSREAELKDISSSEENIAVGEYLYELLRGFCEEPSVQILGSIAGGRKTMGALFVSVMNLLGRPHDRLFHVLVSDPWERIPTFLYPGCEGNFLHPDTGKTIRSADASVSLAELPFLPLRQAFERDIKEVGGGYAHLIQHLRNQLSHMDGDVWIEADPVKGTLAIDDTPIALSPLPYAFYLAFLKRGATECHALTSYGGVENEMKSLAKDYEQPNAYDHWSHYVSETSIDPKEDLRKYAHQTRQALRKAGIDQLTIHKLVPQKGRFSIDIPSENITIHNLNADRP